MCGTLIIDPTSSKTSARLPALSNTVRRFQQNRFELDCVLFIAARDGKHLANLQLLLGKL
jgi:hypothetical protein